MFRWEIYSYGRKLVKPPNFHPVLVDARSAAWRVTSIRKLDLASFHRLNKNHPSKPLDTVVRSGQKGGKPRPLDAPA